MMMFIQFFIWGSWYTMAGQYLDKIGMGGAIGWVYTVGPIAAILSPVFLGMIADRYFASQKVLAALMLVGGAAMLVA
ncbi:MAG: MFS transporter, partial [Planctomycetales bacterium]|nr:MFS transporter [Planctomycetales bacterium]